MTGAEEAADTVRQHVRGASSPTILAGPCTGVIAHCSRASGVHVTGIGLDPVVVTRWSSMFAAEVDAVTANTVTNVPVPGMAGRRILLLFVKGQPVALCTYENV